MRKPRKTTGLFIFLFLSAAAFADCLNPKYNCPAEGSSLESARQCGWLGVPGSGRPNDPLVYIPLGHITRDGNVYCSFAGVKPADIAQLYHPLNF